MNDKKGITTFEMLIWIPRIIFIVVIMFAIMVLIRSYVTTTIDTSEVEANIFINRLIYSRNGISYFDLEINRVYPGVVDLSKFNSQQKEQFLEKTIYYGIKNMEIGAKLVLKDIDKNSEFSAFYNEDFFKEQKKLVDAGFTQGPGGVKGFVKKYNVLIREGSALSKGTLTIDVIIPNS